MKKFPEGAGRKGIIKRSEYFPKPLFSTWAQGRQVEQLKVHPNKGYANIVQTGACEYLRLNNLTECISVHIKYFQSRL